MSEAERALRLERARLDFAIFHLQEFRVIVLAQPREPRRALAWVREKIDERMRAYYEDEKTS